MLRAWKASNEITWLYNNTPTPPRDLYTWKMYSEFVFAMNVLEGPMTDREKIPREKNIQSTLWIQPNPPPSSFFHNLRVIITTILYTVNNDITDNMISE